MAGLPESIGKYKILALVARGGMGAVFKALHPTLRRMVIIKKLTIHGSSQVVERFKREAQILLDMNDPHIVHLFDFFKEGNSHYIVLEYVDGMSLDMLIKRRRYLSGQLSLHIFLDTCRALAYAHSKGIIHRDIKPGNILISKTGNVKLADFGIAAVSNEEEVDLGLTMDGSTLGTPSYMPPEQFKNARSVDARADIYSMGVMLYEMVTGKKPFPGNFAPETIVMIQKGHYVKEKKLSPDVPPLVSHLIRRMIQPNPKRRFKDLKPVIRKIERYLALYPKGALERSLVGCMNEEKFQEPVYKKRTRKHRIFLSIAAFLILGTAGILFSWHQGYLHRLLFSNTTGALTVTVRIQDSMTDSKDIFIHGRLFVHDRADFPEAAVSPLCFTPDMETSSLFSAKIPVLPAGRYRLKLFVQNRVCWHTIEVKSFSVLKDQEEHHNELSLSFNEVAPRFLIIQKNTVDAFSGKNISAAVYWEIFDQGLWQPIDSVPWDRFMTGSIKRFRASAPTYYPEEFSLKIGTNQDDFRLCASLVPLGGGLSISAPKRKMRLLINGSSHLVLAGEDMPTVSLKDFEGGERFWELPAGNYTVDISSKESYAHVAFSIIAGRTLNLVLEDTESGLSLHREEL